MCTEDKGSVSNFIEKVYDITPSSDTSAPPSGLIITTPGCGALVGEKVGRGVGNSDGAPEGVCDGVILGEGTGKRVGCSDGASDGLCDGPIEGLAVGVCRGA